MTPVRPAGRTAMAQLLGSTLIGNVFGLASGVALARGLGVESRGAYQLFLLAYMLLPAILSLSIGTAASAGYGTNIGGLLRQLRALPIIWASAAIVSWIFLDGRIDRSALIIFLLMLPWPLSIPFLTGGIQFLGLFRELSIARLIDVTGSGVIVVLLFAAGRLSLHTAVLAQLIPTALTASWLFGLLWARKDMRFPHDGAFRFGVQHHAGYVAQIATSRLDQLVVGSLGNVALGVYAVAGSLAAQIAILPGVIQQILVPRIAMAKNESSERRTEYLLARSARLVIVFGTSITAGFALVGGPLLGLIFGEPYRAAYTVAVLLMLSTTLLGVSTIYESALAGLGLPGQLTRIRLMGLTCLGGALVASRLSERLWPMALAVLLTALTSCLMTNHAAARALDCSKRDLITRGADQDASSIIRLARRRRARRPEERA